MHSLWVERSLLSNASVVKKAADDSDDSSSSEESSSEDSDGDEEIVSKTSPTGGAFSLGEAILDP